MADKIPPQTPEALTHRHKPGPNVIEDSHEQHGNTHHIVPVSTYIKVILALMGLLILTVVAALFDLAHIWGPLNILIAMAIATTKALLIFWYFMHLKFSSKSVIFVAGAGFMWLLIMFALGMSDYFTRSWMYVS